MNERYGKVVSIEGKPEHGPMGMEVTPPNRFDDLKRILATEGEEPLQSADLAGMEEMFEGVLKERGFEFGVISPEKSGGGKKYDVQRENLVKVVGETTVIELEGWGEKLFSEAGRKTYDVSTGKTGVVLAQVVLDLYRFAARLRTQEEPNTDQQRTLETVTKLKKRIKNWHDKSDGVKNPSGCSGEIMAKVIDWMLTGEMTLPETGTI